MTESSATARPLVPVQPHGRTGGMRNLVRKELGLWWGTRLWWIQTLIWVAILNGITTIIMLDPTMSPELVVHEAVTSFLLIGATAIGIGVVLTVQGAIVGERELGTAAWVMSKPASRSSFVLAKLVAHAVGFLVTALLVPAVIFAVEAALLLPRPVSYASLALAVGLLALAVLFYVVLTLALGTLFQGRGPVAGIGIGLLLAGVFFKGMLPPALVYPTPWLLGDVAGSVALRAPLDAYWYVPALATTAAAGLLVLVALHRFRREEL